MVVRGRKDAEVIGGRDGGRIFRHRVSDRGRVAGDGGLLKIVGGLGAGQETLMTDDGIQAGRRPSEEIEKSTSVKIGLLEEEVDLGALGLGAR